MSHMIDETTGRPAIAYVGPPPWHGLGTPIQPDASPEKVRIAAGLDWRAEMAALSYRIPLFKPFNTDLEQTVPNRAVVYRTDTGAALGIVSDRYQLVQPAEVLEFFKEYVEAGDLQLETAGSLAGGRRIWALARLGMDFRIFGQDQVEGYLLLATSMDGSMATTAKFTSVRVVCQNTLSFADRNDTQPTVRITHSQEFNADRVKAQLGLAGHAWEEFKVNAAELSQRKVTDDEAIEWLRRTFGEDQDKGINEQPNQRVLKAVWQSVKGSPGSDLRSADGTAWGLVQGATHYIDHIRGKSQETRLGSAWFGQGAADKRRALDNALKMVA